MVVVTTAVLDTRVFHRIGLEFESTQVKNGATSNWHLETLKYVSAVAVTCIATDTHFPVICK